MKRLFVDTETTGTAKNSRLVELAFVNTEGKKTLRRYSQIVKPDGFEIPQEATDIHGISTEKAIEEGKPLQTVIDDFLTHCQCSDILIAHNVRFDAAIILNEMARLNLDPPIELPVKNTYCTMKYLKHYVGIKEINDYGEHYYKWPSLEELYWSTFGIRPDQKHRALSDIDHLMDVYFTLLDRGVISEPKTDTETPTKRRED